MNDDRVGNDRPGTFGQSAAEDALAADLNALRSESARGIPTLDDTARAISADRQRDSNGGTLMAKIQNLKSRPMYLALACGAVVALALVFVPISYQRTVGHDATLAVAASGLDEGLIMKIAKEYRTAIGAEKMSVEMQNGRCELTARVPSRSRREVESVASVFASSLAARGITAEAHVTPRVEKVSGNVYAAAGCSIVNLTIDRRGKTADEVKASITQQLEAAGIHNPSVDVSLDGNETTVKIHAENVGADGQAAECEFQLRVQGEGSDEAHMLSIHCDPNQTCDQMREQIQGELRSRGVEAEVTVTGSQCSQGQPCSGKCEVQVKVERHR